MAIDLDQLRNEFEFLRKGPGIRHGALLQRVGANVRILCGIYAHDSAATARTKIVSTVEELLRDEPDGVLLAALTGLAGHPKAIQPTLGERVLWLASERRVQPRTARRRIDAAAEALVRAAAALSADAPGPNSPAGWWLRSLSGVLRLDPPAHGVPGIELTEQRTIVFAEDGLEELFGEFSLPRADRSGGPHELEINVVHGGVIRQLRRPTEEHFEFVIELPRRFRAGESHTYLISYRVPDPQPMTPHYVLQPFMPCESLDMTICFDPEHPPLDVWRLDGVAPRLLDESTPTGPRLELDRLFQVRAEFRALVPGRAYGVKWLPHP